MFKKDKEREKAAKMIRDEAKKMSTIFLRLSHATNPKVIKVQTATCLVTKHAVVCLHIIECLQYIIII